MYAAPSVCCRPFRSTGPAGKPPGRPGRKVNRESLHQGLHQLRTTECKWGQPAVHPIQYYFDTGSNDWNWYLQIYWPSYPVYQATALVGNSTTPVTLTHDSYGRLTVGNHPGSGNITIRQGT